MSPTEHRALLRPTAILDYTHPRIEALIQSRGWRRLPTRERIAAIYDFVRNDIAFGYNLADDLPASQNAVIAEACRLLGLPLPPLQTLEQAGLSPMARGFYAENRRIANGKARRVLGWRPSVRDYRQGLAALFAARAQRDHQP